MLLKRNSGRYLSWNSRFVIHTLPFRCWAERVCSSRRLWAVQAGCSAAITRTWNSEKSRVKVTGQLSLSCICDCQSVLVLNNHDGQRARLQHPGRPQEEDEGDQGGVWEVQGGGRRFAKKTRSGNQSERRCKLTNFEFFDVKSLTCRVCPTSFRKEVEISKLPKISNFGSKFCVKLKCLARMSTNFDDFLRFFAKICWDIL